jgi:hypothetical protein
MKSLWMFLLCLPMIGQTLPNPSTNPSPSPNPPATAPPPPQNFVGVGYLYNPSGSPKSTGWASYGKLIDPKSTSYFFTTEDAIMVRTPTLQLQTSARVGVATLMKTLGPVQIFGIVDGGGATTGTASGGAASGGGLAQIPIGKSHYHFAAGFRIFKTSTSSGTPKAYEFGFFKDF